jgi:hypothetical protein
MKNQPEESRFVICIRNEGCDDLELRKVYQVLSDTHAGEDGYLRIIDESGEDYLYPQDCFVPVRLTRAAQEALMASA